MINIKFTIGTDDAHGVTTYRIDFDSVKNFPLFNIGNNSYIDGYGGYIRTSIEQDFRSKRSFFVHNIQIGKYTSIATETTFCVGSNHDYRSLSNRLANKDGSLYPNKGQILVQNDVWIGFGATIMAGVTVHNGAVVAANSHVVKDVPAYSIVGGNPARVIKYRFDKDSIKKLQAIKWWNWSNEKKAANADWLGTYDIKGFCDKFYSEAVNMKANVKSPSYSKIVTGKRIYLYFADFGEFSLLNKVISDFDRLHTKNGGVIYWYWFQTLLRKLSHTYRRIKKIILFGQMRQKVNNL